MHENLCGDTGGDTDSYTSAPEVVTCERCAAALLADNVLGDLEGLLKSHTEMYEFINTHYASAPASGPLLSRARAARSKH